MKIEKWNGYKIRFIERDSEWWAVLKDVCSALKLKTYYVKERLDGDIVSTEVIKDSLNRQQKMLIVNEYGVYDTVFQSRKHEAREFKKWVYEILSKLRKASGLEGFQIFRTLDKEHQREMMKKLHDGLKVPVKVDYIKANTIANKAVSLKHGYLKMIKKADMDSKMLVDRQHLLDDTVELMTVKDRYGLDISVSQEIYKNI